MDTSLEDLLYRLASSSEMRARFAADPEAALQDSKLSPEEHDAIISGDIREIAKLLPAEYDPPAVVVVWSEDL
jgi:Aromatic-ring-opening dioxygenase LigAB, LigA subunit